VNNLFAQIPTNGLIAQYGFDNGALLVDGANGQNFTQIGTALTEVNNRFGNLPNSAVSLDGDYLTRPDISFGDYHSYSFWLKVSSTSTGRKVIIDDSNRTATNSSTWTGTRVTLNNGSVDVSIRYRINTVGSLSYRGLTSISTTDIRDDRWHHITLLLECRRAANSTSIVAIGTTQIFVDGVSEDLDSDRFGSSSISTSINGNGNLTVANDRTNSLPITERYDGQIDDLLIYNRVLSISEIQNIIASNNYCLAPSVSIISATNIAQTATDISITGSETYDIAYHKTSEPFANATIVSNLSSGILAINNLDVATEYQLYIREQCAITTAWSTPILFTTSRPTGKLYVDKNATGTGTGLDWTNAFTELSDAVAAALANEEIWVAGGTYHPHATSRNTYFNITQENLKIYGGFTGTETQLSDRVLGMNETILSGDLQENDVNVADFISNYANTTRNTDNSYHVVNITNTGENLLLDGLTISDAHNNLNNAERGGAIVKHKNIAKLTLKNCIVKDNVSRNDNAGLVAEFELYLVVAGANAGQINGGNGFLTIENCEFTNNMSRWGSGVYCFVRRYTKIDIIISNSLFDANIAGDLNTTTAKGLSGPAAWLRNIGGRTSELDIKINNTTFVNNKGTGTNPSINNFNRATLVLTKGTSRIGSTTAVVSNAIFWSNTSGGGATSRSITDQYTSPLNNLSVVNSIDQANFNDDSITSKTNTSNADPLFTDAINRVYTLSTGSPAIDSGDNTSVIGQADLLGNQRVFNTTVDMGAYEFGAQTLSNDVVLTDTDKLTIYPNPVSDVVYITENVKSLQLYNINGQLVAQTTAQQLNVSQLPAGIYFVKIIRTDGSIISKKIIKN